MTSLKLMFLFIFFSQLAVAQSWSWARASVGGAGSSKAVATDKSGNVYIAGNYDDGHISFGAQTLQYAGQSDSYLVKYDPSGNVLWAQNIGSSCGDYANDLCTDGSGNVFVTGYFCSSSLTIGSYTLSGYSGSFNIFLAKYDADGNVLWAKTSTGITSCDNLSYGVASDLAGNCYITGTFSSSTFTMGNYALTNGGSSGSNCNMFIAKFDGNGNVLWAKKAGAAKNAKAFSVCTDANGNAFVAGSFLSPTISFDAITLNNTGNYDSYLVKYNSSGAVLWAKSGTCSRDDEAKAVSADEAGNVYITGYFSSASIVFDGITMTNANPAASNYRENIFVVKCNSAGLVTWAKSAGGISNSAGDFGYSVSAYNDGVFVSGSFGSPSITMGNFTLTPSIRTNNPMFIAQYNSTGNIVYASFLESGGMIKNAIAADKLGNVYATGSFNYPASPLVIGTQSLTYSGINTVFLSKLSAAYLVPVGLSQFNTSVINNGNIKLSWHTEQETNISAYVVERSTWANAGFEPIASLLAKGGSSAHEYAFTDQGPNCATLYYYRIGIVELGTSMVYSVIKTAKCTMDRNEDIRFAFPTAGKLQISHHLENGPLRLQMLNEQGQLVLAKQFMLEGYQPFSLDISRLVSGNYWVHIFTNDRLLTKKFVK